MTKVAEVIKNIRQELSDENNTRWNDTQLIRFITQATTRAQHVGRRNNLPFLKAKVDLVFVAGEASKLLPADFLVDTGLYDLGLKRKLPKVTEEEWEVASPSVASQYMLEDGSLVIQSVPTADKTLRLRYFKGCNLDGLKLADADMPWNGQLDTLIEEYAALRARNIDRDSAQADFELLKDLENNILNTLGSQAVTVVKSRGWLA